MINIRIEPVDKSIRLYNEDEAFNLDSIPPYMEFNVAIWLLDDVLKFTIHAAEWLLALTSFLKSDSGVPFSRELILSGDRFKATSYQDKVVLCIFSCEEGIIKELKLSIDDAVTLHSKLKEALIKYVLLVSEKNISLADMFKISL